MRALTLLPILCVAACTTGPTADGQPVTSAPVPPPALGRTVDEAPAPDFPTWEAGFRARALASGIRPATYDAAMAGVTPNDRVIALDRRQPEFSRPIWEYLDSAVSQTRISNGRARGAEQAALLDGIERRFGVDKTVVLAIWGLESAYGGNLGDFSVVRSLATLAHDGRRSAFGEDQLLAALRILEAGDTTAAGLKGSWAGAMGHTQFIPTTFLEHAVDYTGDGRRDVWSRDPSDALASAANYLAASGWTLGAPAVVEVSLPASFDYLLADGRRQTASEWTALGVTARTGGALTPSDGVEILLPAGARGPAFAAYPNFRVIKRYNNATSYALAVAHLAERIGGGPAFRGAWPRGDRSLSRTEKVELQERLTALGYDTQGADGIVGPNTRAAVRSFQAANGLTPDAYVSDSLLSQLRAAGG